MKIRVLVGLAASMFSLMLFGLALASDVSFGGDEVSDVNAEEWLTSYRTVEEAQAVVPFDIHVPLPPEGYRFSYIQVDTVPIGEQTDQLILVESIFVSETGGHLMLSQANRPGTPPEGADVFQVAVDDAEILVDPRDSPGGTETATLYWEAGGFTYHLIASELSVDTLLEVAASMVGR